ncbi:MAG TPA: PQQ-dependent sugar dehydrogenase [Flavobacterium sp.]|jgi:glucose/arabinose dehydrogenase
MKYFTLFACLICASGFSQTIGITSFATGFDDPVEITHAGDSRLFVVEQTGAIKILNSNGTVNPTNFLTLTTSLISIGSERGLLGLAFHPDYSSNGYFYVNYTRSGDGTTVISRYSVNASNPNIADPDSGTPILTVAQPFSNHNGGTIKFGPDGFLYIGMGDGGSAGDPGNRAQNKNENLGKMLRIDVNADSPYGIPPGNPFVGTDGNDEIWALGLRNPWKFSFDSSNGNLWIADVGQGQVEEINKNAYTDAGINYGWKCFEGNNNYSTCTNPDTYTFPFAQYTHSGTGGCSITGGYVYNGSMYPNFLGKYFFADYCLNRIGTVDPEANIAYSATFSGNNNFTTFGEDMNGELYVAAVNNGTVFKVVDTSLSNHDLSANGYSLYPNPAAAEVFIKNSSQNPLRSFKLYDLAGKLLLNEQLDNVETNSISTASLQSGLYLVTVEDAGGTSYSTRLAIK